MASLVLALVLVVAAATKLRRPGAVADDFASLGLSWPKGLAVLVPLVELVCAVALVVRPGWGGVASFALLAAFTAVLVGVIRSGRVVACRCFGAISDKPVSWKTLVRNGLLLAIALVATLA